MRLIFSSAFSHCGIAFVVVQHLDPTHKGIMVELLQRATTMPVVQVKDRQKVEPDCVYVISPNKDLSILHGVLHLLEPAAPRGLRLPSDINEKKQIEDTLHFLAKQNVVDSNFFVSLAPAISGEDPGHGVRLH